MINKIKKALILLCVILFAILAVIILLTGCNSRIATEKTDIPQENENVTLTLSIQRKPVPLYWERDKLSKLPEFNLNSGIKWEVDLRGYDLTSLDISDRKNDLIHSFFDDQTKWSKELPKGFDPKEIMEIGKNPGLKIRSIHDNGITGAGIAIIDYPPLVEHSEYKENLKMYNELNWKRSYADMHGAAVASIAVGKTVGVAPGADLYFVANNPGYYDSNHNFIYDFNDTAKLVDAIIEINNQLPINNKIRVISISVAWLESQKGYKEITAAVDRAKKNNIFVVSGSLWDTYGFAFQGLGRPTYADPDNPLSYEPAFTWQHDFFTSDFNQKLKKKYGIEMDSVLLAPMDARCTASPTGNDDYVYYSEGGISWTIPYIAGLYALACQVKPDITPEEFWQTALSTGSTRIIERSGTKYKLERIVNPVKLIDSLGN